MIAFSNIATTVMSMTVGLTAIVGGNDPPRGERHPWRGAIDDFMRAADDLTPRALAVPPTQLPVAGELRFAIEVSADEMTDVSAPAPRRVRSRPRELLPIRSRPGSPRRASP